MFTDELDQLYQRLKNYQLDDPSHEFGFTRHLIRNNGWTKRYADRAIAEYKKFVFLTVVAEHQIVPSDTVDQVWHAHLLLTKSYWEEFCPQILGKKLHHHPTKGGKEERAKFHDLYRQTIASYQKYFGKPPQDIWSPPEIRFGKEVKMQRFSKVDNWIISKNLFQKYFFRLAVVSFVISLLLTIFTVDRVLANSSTQIASNFSVYKELLLALIALLLPILTNVVVYRHIRQPETQANKPLLNMYEVAYLAGGKKRVIELAITKLVFQGYLRPNIKHRTFAISKAASVELNSLEHQVMDRVRQTPEFKKSKEVAKYNTNNLRMQLEQNKLLIEPIKLAILTSWALLLLFFILIGWRPFAYMGLLKSQSQLTCFWFGNFILFVNLIKPRNSIHRLTTWGDRVLKDIRKQDTGFDPIQRFALYGESSLSGGVLDDLKQIYKAQKQEDDAAGCGC